MLAKEMKTSIDDLVTNWTKKTTVFQSKNEVREATGALFTSLVNMVKPMMVQELQGKFVENPLSFLATGDQVAAIDAWAHVKQECDKQMADFKNFFDKKFETTMKQLEKQPAVVELVKQQDRLQDAVVKLDRNQTLLDKTTSKTSGVVSNILAQLAADQEKQNDQVQADATKFELVINDLVATVVAGSEWDISRIRALLTYLASTTSVHAADAKMSVSTWTEVVAAAMTNFRISADKRLTRTEVWNIIKTLNESKECEKLFKKMRAVVDESDHEARNYDSFKFQTWAKCSRHRSTAMEERQSVQEKKALKAKKKRKLVDEELPEMESLRDKKKSKSELVRKSVDPAQFEKEKHRKRGGKPVSERRLAETQNKWLQMQNDLDKASGSRSSQREATSEESDNDEEHQNESSDSSE